MIPFVGPGELARTMGRDIELGDRFTHFPVLGFRVDIQDLLKMIP